MDQDQLNAFAAAVCAAALQLPRAASGRQNDAGANLQPAGVLIIPLSTDPGLAGKIFCADLVELKAGRQGWHEVATIRDGEEGASSNVKPLGGGVGDITAIASLLAGHLGPGILPALLASAAGSDAGGNPLALLAGLLARKGA